ncbi:Hypothetical predicted protein [Mytilus galloprovincialis]|uniref:DUF4806 domain-containing protein n=1 Tax=Mytilus galloprovincialis TaxID=29158 RepID=A0A8B6GEL8_MYTGA|nr:Hypothetical predicted protein [Mytilus galloprovincialis]
MPSYQYVVVEFLDEGSVEVVHQTWLESEEKVMFCYWPRKNSTQCAKKGQIPDKEFWRRYRIRIFSYTDDYEKALKKRQRAIESSNMDTNDEEEARRAVKQPQRLGHDFSDSEEEEKRPTRRDGDRRTPSTSARRTPSPPTRRTPSTSARRTPSPPTRRTPSTSARRTPSPPTRTPSTSARRTPSPPTRRTPSTSARRTPSPPTRKTPTPPTYDPSSAYHGKNSNRNRSRSPLRSTPERRRRSLSTPDSGRRTSTIRATPEGPAVRELERRRRVLPDFERDSQEDISTPRSFEDKVTMGLARIERTLLEHSQMLRRLISGQPTTSFDGDLDLDDLIPSPVKTVDELAELTARFLEDRDFPKKLVRVLGALGGSNIGDTLRRIMRRIGSNSLWSLFSLKGKNKKTSLKAEPIYKIITKSCIAVHSNGKESDIDEALSDFLRHAPHQAGGLKYKKPAPANIPPAQVTTHQQPL